MCFSLRQWPSTCRGGDAVKSFHIVCSFRVDLRILTDQKSSRNSADNLDRLGFVMERISTCLATLMAEDECSVSIWQFAISHGAWVRGSSGSLQTKRGALNLQ